MPSILTSLLLASQAVGQNPGYAPPQQPHEWHVMVDGQQLDGQYAPPPGQPAIRQFDGQPAQPAAGQVQTYTAPAKPLPSKELIEEERDQFVQEAQLNAQAEVQRLEQEVNKAKRKFAVEQEEAKKKYFADLDADLKKHYQVLDKHLAAQKQESAAAADEYAKRVQRQSQNLIQQREMQDHHDNHKSVADSIADEERQAKEEQEHQIRAAYDATRWGGSFADPKPAVKSANERFNRQMQELAQRRAAAHAELQQKIAGAAPAH